MGACLASCRDADDLRRFNTLVNVPFCEAEGCERFGEIRSQGCSYAQQLCNWARFCDEHQADADAYWAEQWREYYADVL